MPFEQNPFLQAKYGLSKSPEVESAAKRTEARTGEPVPEDPASRIQNYLDRIKNVLNPPRLEGGSHRPDFDRRERNLEMLKRSLHGKFVIKQEDIPESYFNSIKLKHRKEGHGDIEIPEDLRQELAGTIVAEQESSLDNWVDYLASDDAKYPDALKYWTMRSVLKMGRYDKGKKKFTERYGGAVSPFPDINREALAYIIDAVEKKYEGRSVSFPYDIQDEEKKEFDKFLQNENFPKLYAWAIDKINPVSEELLKITDGEWRPYPKGSDHMLLAESLGGKGTGWCIAGEATAKRYLQGGAGNPGGNDLEVFYSLDEEGKPTIPRVVIVSADGKISEVRGVAKEENLDPHIGGVVQAKLAQLPDGKAFEKTAGDMKRLTAIDEKAKANQSLDKDDLIFLYEIEAKIEGFGYKRDPRIKELRDKRNLKEDAPIVFECQPNEIAWNKEDVKEATKAYVGPLFPNIFKTLSHLERIYTAFPEGKISRGEVEIGGDSATELQVKLEVIDEKTGNRKFPIHGYAQDMLNKMYESEEFQKLAKNPENIQTVRLKVGDLFNDQGTHTTDEIYKKAEELGLELCPAEVGPHLRLNYKEQPLNEWVYIAMKQITGPDGSPGIFRLVRHADGLWLGNSWAGPASTWNPRCQFVFRVRK
ncbi:MAG: hypothetical protein WC750_01255 [Patescibacteria group bacterium]|jgi:hypothetical protein